MFDSNIDINTLHYNKDSKYCFVTESLYMCISLFQRDSFQKQNIFGMLVKGSHTSSCFGLVLS